MAFVHNSAVKEDEPKWGSVDKTKLPGISFANVGDKEKVSTWSYPHHWIDNPGTTDDKGRYTTGKMYLSISGFNAAWAAANGARTGKKASPEIIEHLNAHKKAIEKEEPIRKSDQVSMKVIRKFDMQRVVVGIVYEPYTIDKQGMWAKPETIARAAHNFLQSPNFAAGIDHNEFVNNIDIRKEAKRAVVESYIAPCDMNIGNEYIKEGSWVMGVKIFDDEEWERVRSGEWSGFSMHGQGIL